MSSSSSATPSPTASAVLSSSPPHDAVAAPAAKDPPTTTTAFEKRILVTGGAGFIGSHVVTHLVKRYPTYYIVNLDSLDYCSCVHNVHSALTAPIDSCSSQQSGADATASLDPDHCDNDASDDDYDDAISTRLRGSFCEWDHYNARLTQQLPQNYKFVKGSIASADLVEFILQTYQIDTILHFAAQSHVDHSFGNSIAFSETNILGTHVLLEAARLYGGITRFIHVSTDEVYGEGTRSDKTGGMREDHVLEPTNPYAASKAGAEFLVKTYQRSFRLPTIITRSNNVFGPHQYPEKLIPKLINQIARGTTPTLHGDGRHTRNYLYISDVVAAFDVVLHRGVIGQVYNIGSDNEVANRQVAMDLLALMAPCDSSESNLNRLTFVADRPFNDLRYTIDATKLRSLGWRERVSWTDGLQRTIAWYKRHGHRFGNIDEALKAHPMVVRKPKTFSVSIV